MKAFKVYFPYIYVCVILTNCCNGDRIMEDVLDTVERSIKFYSESYADMNIDGIFGLRVIEGQLDLMLTFLKSKSTLEAGLRKVYGRLDEAHRKAKTICDDSLASLNKTDGHYFEVMHRVVMRPWHFARNYRRIDRTLKWKNSSSSVKTLDEKLSDKCMNELLGSEMMAPCNISIECVTTMSVHGMDGYGITHQLLYTMLAEESGCLKALNTKFSHLPNQSLTVDKLQKEFCANNFFETSDSVIKQNGVVSPNVQDLFLEQELVCPMLGYAEFLHNDWLQQILSWQLPSGCYGDNSDEQRQSTVDNNAVDLGQRTHLAPINKHIHVRPTTLQGIPESVENDGVLMGVKSLTNAVPIPAGRNPREEFVGLNSNARKSGYNDSKIRRRIPVLGMIPMDKERGQLGNHHIKLNRRGGFPEQAVGEHNHEQGRVGDTRMRVEEKIGNQGDGNQPNIASDEDNFRINRQINRKLLYEKTLKDGCFAHKTAVAMGALSQYLRFLLFANASGFDATNYLKSTNYLMYPASLPPSFAGFMPSEKSATVKSSTSTKMPVWVNANGDRPDLVRQRGMRTDRFKNRATRVITTVPPVDKVRDADYDPVDKTKKGQKSEADLYDGDDVNDEHPIVKSQEDDLLLYNELITAKPRVVTAVPEEVHPYMAKASHMHGSGDSSFEGVSSISSTYAFVIVVAAVILLVLYRLLLKHRIGFQHRHVRWK